MSNADQNKEIEVRFKEINPEQLKKQLADLGFVDQGEDFFTEVIFYDKDLVWRDQRKVVTRYVRLRKSNIRTLLTYKNQRQDINTSEAQEVEFEVSSLEKARDFLEAIGLTAYRTQEKKRHKFTKGDVVIDIDTWPQVPTYVEIEAPHENEIKSVAAQLGFDWKDVIWENAGNLIEKYYNLMVSQMKYYTFDKIEYYKEK